MSTRFLAFALLVGCSNQPGELVSPATTASAPANATASAAAAVPQPMIATSAAPPGDVPAPNAPSPSASAAPAEQAADAGSAEGAVAIDWKNQQPFTLASDELTARARALFDAIVKDAPELGESFWFPKEPFIPLKDVKGPGKYWDTLHASYVEDIHALHRSRKSWDGATFTSFTVGSAPKWVKPGEEANKIGYYRSFRGMIAFSADGHANELEVHTLITWQGRWFVTHLRKIKH